MVAPLVSIVATIVYYLLLIFFLLMWGRFVLDLVRTFSRSWRPRGFGLVLAELVYTITDPPVRFVRRFIPPLRLGPVAIDLAWTITMLACVLGMSIAVGFRAI